MTRPGTRTTGGGKLASRPPFAFQPTPLAFRPSLRLGGIAGSLAIGAIGLFGGCGSEPSPAVTDEDGGVLPIARAAPAAPEAKLTPALRRALESGSPERHRALVDLSVQLDLHAFGRGLLDAGADRMGRREAVVRALGAVAEQTRAGLEPLLDDLGRRGELEVHRHFTVVNRLLVSGSANALRALADRPEVASLLEETVEEPRILAAFGAEGGAGAAGSAQAPGAGQAAGRSWALAEIGAPQAWERGLSGAGVVVGLLDAGVSAAHEQLAASFRGGDDSWHDPLGGSPRPVDAIWGHGTSVLSAAVARNLEGKLVGAAPGARWVACLAVPDGRYHNVALTECADWILNVAQPDVLILPWVLPRDGCDRELQRILDAWRAAEILPVIAAGNYGPERETDRSPANYVDLYPGGRSALAIGGVTADGRVFPGSSRGPSRCGDSVFPTVVAPADDVSAAFPLTPTTYVQAGGTSIAAGLAAGAAAILLEGYPDAAVWEVEEAMARGAVDLGPPGPDDAYGFGRLSLPGALDALGRLLESRAPTNASAEAPAHR